MNAQEQHDHYSAKIEAILDRQSALNSMPMLDFYSLDLARKILSDLKLKIDAYGEKTYPMTDKQVAAVERGINQETARLDAIENSVKMTEDRTIKAEMTSIDPTYDGSDERYDDTLYMQARRVVRGQTTRFEAKQVYEARRQERDYLASCEALFGFNQADEIATRAQRIHHTATIKTWDAIAKVLGYENFIDIEVRWNV